MICKSTNIKVLSPFSKVFADYELLDSDNYSRLTRYTTFVRLALPDNAWATKLGGLLLLSIC